MSRAEPADDHWQDLPTDDRSGVSPFRKKTPQDSPGDGRFADGAASFERVPPQDLDAEQSVLGGMLLSKDAIADVVEVIKGPDFYRPAHETIFHAILDLYARGEPADPITTAAELTKRGELARVGGTPYLHTLVNAVPTAANAQYYAEIVHERAVLRRLVEAGTRITQMGYAADGDVDDIVNNAQAEIYAVTEQRTAEDYLPLSDIMEGALDEIEAIGSRSGQMSGVPTGFADLDALTNGLHPGQMVVIAARPAMGKALALDTPLPTPFGWTTMGEVRPGDLLLAADGTATRVVAATEVMTGRPCYEVVFDDGTRVIADADHLWLTQTRAARRGAAGRRAGAGAGAGSDADGGPGLVVPSAAVAGAGSPGAAVAGAVPGRSAVPGAGLDGAAFPGATLSGAAVRTTKEIAATLRCTTLTDERLNHSVPSAAPLDLPEADLPVPPYTLGCWLGAGRTDAPAQPGGAPFTRRPAELLTLLRDLGLLGNKHIPAAYLRSCAAQRRALLAGLLDAAATVTSGGTVRFPTDVRTLARDVGELLLTLGHRGRVRTRAAGRPGRTYDLHTVSFRAPCEVFGNAAKRRLHAQRRRPATSRAARRFIADVHEVPSVPVRCVEVDHPDHLYLATRSLIPTHNSTLALDFARTCSIAHRMPSVIFSLEMGRNEIAMRLLSAEARVALHHMRSGTMTDDDWTKVARRMTDVTDAPLYIDDSPNLSMMEIRAKCRRLKQRNDLRLVVIDYLQLMQSGGSRRPESRQQEVSDMSRNLKLLAKELEVPVVALSQLNRGPEQRTDKKPMISDLRESGSIEQDADVVILLHREDAYEKESPRAGEADLIVAKHRNGPTATITVAFQGHYSRFVDMAHT